MKYIKTYEALRGTQISKQLLNTVMYSNTKGDPLLISILANDYKNFKKYVENYNQLKNNKLKLIETVEQLKKNNVDDKKIEQFELFIKKLDLIISDNSIENTDDNGNTSLLIAAKEGRLKMVKELINAGANIYHTNNNGESFYDLAVNRYKFINNVKDWIEKNYPEVIAMKKFNL